MQGRVFDVQQNDRGRLCFQQPLLHRLQLSREPNLRRRGTRTCSSSPCALFLCSKKLLQAQRYCPGKFDDPKLWIAYPLLDWVTQVPTIRQGTAQPLLLTVRSKVSTPPGIYTVELTVTSGSGHTQAVPVIVRVRPIVIPEANTLQTLWGDEERSPNMTEFLLAHRLPAGSTIYGGERGTLWPSYADSVSRLAALWQSGKQHKITVCDWSQCAGQANGQGAECIANREAQLRNATALLDRAGWPRDARYLYLTDEMLQGWAQSHDIINDPSGLFQEALSEEARQLELIVSIAPELEIVATGFPSKCSSSLSRVPKKSLEKELLQSGRRRCET